MIKKSSSLYLMLSQQLRGDNRYLQIDPQMIKSTSNNKIITKYIFSLEENLDFRHAARNRNIPDAMREAQQALLAY